MPVDPIRVVVADHHPAMRRSLCLLLDGEADMRVVAEAGDLTTVAAQVQRRRPHVIVLDLGMYNLLSVKALGRGRRNVSDPAIVVLTMEESPMFQRRAIEAGASGFVVKDRAGGELPDAIRRAARGDAHVSTSGGPCLLHPSALVGT